MMGLEYKHKSANLTIQKTRGIMENILHNEKFTMLDLRLQSDQDMFRKCIPIVDYRAQVIHQAHVLNCGAILFVNASTGVEYMLLVLVPESLRNAYTSMMQWIKSNHLAWLFKPESDEFDQTLAKMPSFANVDFSHAVDEKTVKSKLQLMMGLIQVRNRLGHPLQSGRMLLPTYVALWNALKGGVDDFSKVLSHCLGTWGGVSPMNVIWIRFWSTCLYNAWRLYGLHKAREYLFSDKCDSFQKFQHNRHRLGEKFQNFLIDLVDRLDVPSCLVSSSTSSSTPSAAFPQTIRPNQFRPYRRLYWNTQPQWKNLRLENTAIHASTKLDYIPLIQAQSTNGPSTNLRRWCYYCMYVEKSGEAGAKPSLKHKSFFVDGTQRLVYHGCSVCAVPLCRTSPSVHGNGSQLSCFERFHSVANIPTQSTHGPGARASSQ